MKKASFAILSLVLGMVLFLLSCSKTNHESIAFVGDESDMKDCYQLYPKDYFPSSISQELMNGKFPPDLSGEYEIHGLLQYGTYARYNLNQQQYVPVPTTTYNEKYLKIIIENQVNGMAKIKFAMKTNNTSEYKNWYEVDAYIYGDVFSDKNQFMICYENVENNGDVFQADIGNIIIGQKDSNGLINIDYWTIYKDVRYTALIQGVPQVYGYAYYHANMTESK